MTNNQYLLKKLNPFRGWTVKMGVPDGEFLGIVLQSPDKKKEAVLWLQSDEEGNGPGWFEIRETEAQ